MRPAPTGPLLKRERPGVSLVSDKEPDWPAMFDIVDVVTGDVVNSVTIATGDVPPTAENLAAFGYTHHCAELRTTTIT